MITKEPLSSESVINSVKTNSSGCVVTYVGVIRQSSRGKEVLSVEYRDITGQAKENLQRMADEVRQRWQINDIAIHHRADKLGVGEINLVVAVSSAHRQDGFAACQHVIDRFKQVLPTRKTETYRDGSVWVEGG